MKPERVHVGSDQAPAVFLLEAIVALGDDWMSTLFPEGVPTDGVVDVVLTVEGHQVPFQSVVKGFHDRMRAHQEHEVSKKALALLDEAGLMGIYDAIREAEWKITEAIRGRFPDELR